MAHPDDPCPLAGEPLVFVSYSLRDAKPVEVQARWKALGLTPPSIDDIDASHAIVQGLVNTPEGDHDGWLQAQCAAPERKLRVFRDMDDIDSGQEWSREIDLALMRCGAVLFLLGPGALASEWVYKEVVLAHGRLLTAPTSKPFELHVLRLPGVSPDVVKKRFDTVNLDTRQNLCADTLAAAQDWLVTRLDHLVALGLGDRIDGFGRLVRTLGTILLKEPGSLQTLTEIWTEITGEPAQTDGALQPRWLARHLLSARYDQVRRLLLQARDLLEPDTQHKLVSWTFPRAWVPPLTPALAPCGPSVAWIQTGKPDFSPPQWLKCSQVGTSWEIERVAGVSPPGVGGWSSAIIATFELPEADLRSWLQEMLESARPVFAVLEAEPHDVVDRELVVELQEKWPELGIVWAVPEQLDEDLPSWVIVVGDRLCTEETVRRKVFETCGGML